MPTSPVSWSDDEEGLRGALRELARLSRRAAARPLLTLGLTLALSAGLVLRAWRKNPVYESHAIFRVTEGDLEQATAATPNRALKAYIQNVIFSNEALAAVMKRHHLGGPKLISAPAEAAESMRDEDIEVNVWSNYFNEYRGYDDPARSAHLAIEYAHGDPQMAYEVVCDLAAMVTEHEELAGIARAEREVAGLDDLINAARGDLVAAQIEISVKELALGTVKPADRARLLVDLGRLKPAQEGLTGRLQKFEQQRDAYRLRAEMERRQLGLRFEVVEAPHQALVNRSRPRRLAMLGALFFALLLPLVGMAVGAYDSRVRDAVDLRRLGLEPLGQVPGFAGDDVGSLDQRIMRYNKKS